MRDYGKVSTSLWNSRKFGALDDAARLLYLYLHTCPHVNSAGCFVMKEGYAITDLGWDAKAYRKAMQSLSIGGLVGFDSLEEVVRLINFLTFDPFTNPKHATGAIKIAISLPDCEQKLLCLKDLAENKFAAKSENLAKAIDSLSKGFRNPEPEPEPEPPFSIVQGGAGGEKPKPKTDRAKVVEILSKLATPEAAASFAAYRIKMKKPLTETGATRLNAQLEKILQAGHDPDDALGLAEERGWQSVKAEWYENEKGQQNGNRDSRNTQGRRAGTHDSLLAGLAHNVDKIERSGGKLNPDDDIPY